MFMDILRVFLVPAREDILFTIFCIVIITILYTCCGTSSFQNDPAFYAVVIPSKYYRQQVRRLMDSEYLINTISDIVELDRSCLAPLFYIGMFCSRASGRHKTGEFDSNVYMYVPEKVISGRIPSPNHTHLFLKNDICTDTNIITDHIISQSVALFIVTEHLWRVTLINKPQWYWFHFPPCIKSRISYYYDGKKRGYLV